jgi:uncharacterized membrane protein
VAGSQGWDTQGHADRRGDLALVVLVLVGLVLRLAVLGRPGTLSPDESYSAWVSAQSVPDIVVTVRATDPHPPLSYLVFAPVVALTSSEPLLRLPSALCSAGAVAVLACWQRRRGVEGLLATGLFAVLPSAVDYGVQARMYGLMELLGVSAAAAAARWLTAGDHGRHWTVLAAVAGTAAALTHATGFLVLAGLLVVPGLDRRREAWVWRAAMAGGLAAFAALWGPTALAQRGASLYRPLTLDSAAVTLNETVAPLPDQRWVVLAILAAGAVAVVARRGPTGRVLTAAYLVPLALAAALGTRIGLFIPKTLVVLGWGVAVALAGAVGAAGRWRWPAGAVAGVVVVVLVAPAVPAPLDRKGAESVVGHLAAVVGPGDVVASHPPDNVLRWYVFTDRDRRRHPAPVAAGWPDTLAAQVGDGPFSGRVWLVDSTFLGPPLALDRPPCAAEVVLPEARRVRCLQVASP